jgi:hypothetical protein
MVVLVFVAVSPRGAKVWTKRILAAKTLVR